MPLPTLCTALLAALLAHQPDAADHTPTDAVTDAAVAFLHTIDGDQRAAVMFPFDHDARTDWHFVPRQRPGLRIDALTPEQAAAFDRLLTKLLSDAGRLKALGIVQLEQHLRDAGGDPAFRDPGNYVVQVFGDPRDPDAPWSLRVEGHHLSLNLTAPDAGHAAITPAFLGANPHRVPTGAWAGFRVLALEEDRARALLLSLDADQRTAAVIADQAPRDILLTPGRDARLDATGLPASDLTPAQRDALRALIDLYLGNHDPALAAHLRDAVHADLRDRPESVHFVWAGSADADEPHYYRVQAPSLVLEYDNIQNGANHSHTLLRSPDHDFAEAWLTNHHAHHHTP